MTVTAGQSVPFLYSPSTRQVPAGLEHINNAEPAQEGTPMA